MPLPSPRRLAYASSRHPRRTLVAWAVAFVAAIAVIATLLSSATTTDILFRGEPEALRGRAVLKDKLGVVDHAVETVVVRAGDGPVATPAVKQRVARTAAALRALQPDVVDRVVTAFDPGAPPTMIARDGRTALVTIAMAGDINEGERNLSQVQRIVADLDGDGVRAQMAGPASARHTNAVQAERDLSRGELMIGLPVAMVVLFLVFRAVGAMVLPLTVAFVSIILALAVTAIAGQISPLSFFVTNMITMMGLAVGIDYALFIVSRYREERARGVDIHRAVDIASATSGRAVGFSGLAVIVALVGLLIVPTSIFGSLALGAIFVVAAAVLASMTLLPAMLRVMGDRIEFASLPRRSRHDEQAQARGFARVADAVMRRPVIATVLAAGVMLAAAAPYLDVSTGANGVESLPPSSDARQAFDVLRADFGAGSGGPLIITMEGDLGGADGAATVARVKDALSRQTALGPAQAVISPAGDAAVVSAPMTIAPASPQARRVVENVRAALPAAIAPAAVATAVTGESAFNTDFFAITDHYLPIVFAMVLVLSFIVLLVAFRSLVVPLVAIAMNLLSVGAAYGLLVLVFQKGVGASLFGFQQVQVIEAWLPLFLFAVLFGLSMDYHVFLLSRIKEHYDLTGDTPGAIRHGIASSARLITGAALIMVAVFAGFAMGELVMFQQMGFGLAVAILLDAFVIRTVLVPAVMRLLGGANWYLPRALRFLPEVKVEG